MGFLNFLKNNFAIVLIVVLAFILRLYRLGDVPASLYWDEASLGYNAYSIATTLHDEHGEFLPIQRFIAFGDYKPPGYIYAAAASIKLLGLSEFSIRLPSAIAGVILVLVTYFLVMELFAKKSLASLVAGLIAISPWSLQMSRAAFEGNLATSFSGLGILLLIKAIRRKKLLIYIVSAIFLILSMYTFNSHRVFVPLITIALCLIYFKALFGQKLNACVFLVSCFLFLLPLFPYLMTRESGLRFQEVAWVNDLAPIELSNERINSDGATLIAKVIHNRRVVWVGEFLKHYTDHFRMDYLFFTGDVNPRLSTGMVGELYLIELPLILAGLYFLIKNRSKAGAIIFAWLLLSPVPASLARETPHALRSLNMLPVPQIIAALGLSQLKNKKITIIVCFLLLVSLGWYLRDYYLFYPARSAPEWQYGYKQMVKEVAKIENNYKCVSVTEDAGRPYIYFLLYKSYPPEKYWSNRNADRDWYGFWAVHSFDKYYFGTNPGGCLRVDYVNSKFTFTAF